jgi:hypothetical protein
VQNCQIREIIDVPWLFAATEIRVQIGTDFQTDFEKDQGIGKAKMRERKEKETKRKKTGESGRQRQEGAWGMTSGVRKESGCL